MIAETDSSHFALVAIGNFAPLSMRPEWFHDMNLAGPDATKAAYESEGFVLVKDVAHYFIDLVEVQVQADRVQLTTSREDAIPTLADLFISVLAALDPTPIEALGVNFSVHLKTENADAWHKAGDRMAPKEFWSKTWPKHVGLRSIQMQLERNDDHKGEINVIVQPSNIVKNGIFVNVNDHFKFDALRSGQLSVLAGEQYPKSIERAENLIKSILAETKR